MAPVCIKKSHCSQRPGGDLCFHEATRGPVAVGVANDRRSHQFDSGWEAQENLFPSVGTWPLPAYKTACVLCVASSIFHPSVLSSHSTNAYNVFQFCSRFRCHHPRRDDHGRLGQHGRRHQRSATERQDDQASCARTGIDWTPGRFN